MLDTVGVGVGYYRAGDLLSLALLCFLAGTNDYVLAVLLFVQTLQQAFLLCVIVYYPCCEESKYNEFAQPCIGIHRSTCTSANCACGHSQFMCACKVSRIYRAHLNRGMRMWT